MESVDKNEPAWDPETGIWKGGKAVPAKGHSKLPQPLWLFGYGSLCWNAGDIPVAEKRIAVLKGPWARRFFQVSTDHRGTPEEPGLVATLIADETEDSDGIVGVAYRIASEHSLEVIDKVDFREKGGYLRYVQQVQLGSDTKFTEESKETVEAVFYAGSVNNPSFASKHIRNDLTAMAKIIASAVGPSGKNSEYFFKLCDFCRQVGVKDSHLQELEAEILTIQSRA
mmetsp:Transcript_1781/g.2100  ORF Transcript_1781/g.2100 Transcript_1781/m.2100 type:complete len:226 (-) Transcript_1781:448-1125(-)|eukprot:CAMPEP_0184016862 /NCGR_PEP_ID=MMETSP0954-20121128/7175_1 /TAXON_ID=627963 /ORGANISM="Aplanochytrium sp, Strain PBS07" /LENGTH=225 /DNA_ID=CAMNT_0026297951 /DNA_START=187 /DNA_END=864 /DNA_ORIENTATION=-